MNKDTSNKIIRVRTRSGAVYEIDQQRQQIRRTGGMGQSLKRIDEAWKPFKKVVVSPPGLPLIILWPDDEPLLPGSPPDGKPGTTSSAIDTIEYVDAVPN